MNRKTRLILLIGVLANLAVWGWVNRAHDAPDVAGTTLAGLSYSPYGRHQDPADGAVPAKADIARDFDLLKEKTGRIRIYSSLGALRSVPRLAAQRGLTVTAGAWLDDDRERNRRELDGLIALANRHRNVERLLVGNEALLRGDMSAEALIRAVRLVRARTAQPVSTAEPWHVWLANPRLVEAVDYIGVQLLPYWEGVPARDATAYLLRRLDQLAAAYPDKPIVLTEIGWPGAGRAIGGARAGRVEQALFLRSFVEAARGRSLDYFIIEAFDQPWKVSVEGLAGGYWGVFDAGRHAKFAWSGPVRERDDWWLWALITATAGLLLAWLYGRSKPTLRPQGAILLAGVTQAAGSALAWAILPAAVLYLSPLEIAVWTALFAAGLVLVGGVFADTLEATDLLWTGPLKRRFPPHDKAAPANDAPMVSIHVPVCNEPPEMVRRTLSALARLDYPNFEVIVLDNNTRKAALWRPVRAQCRALGPRFRFYHYPRLHGFKGGALNRALKHTAPGAAIVAVVDADYTVARDWLKALTPHFADPDIGVVQAPQDYRDGQDRPFKSCCFWEYAGFFRIGMVRRNEADAIIQHGTMTLIRREALRKAGGWAEWCITEDAELGLRLAHDGWKSAYVAQSFGRGVTPDSLTAYKAQRFRWVYGAMQILKRRWRWLAAGRDTKLTSAQRFHYLAGWLPWIADAAGLVFTLGAIGWTTALAVAPEATALPPAAFVVPALAAFAFRQWRLFRLYGCEAPTTLGNRARAALGGLALSHTVAKAVFWGLLTKGRPFLRTAKYRRGPELLRALAMAREETVFLAALAVAAIGFAATNGLWHRDAWLWLAMLAVMALPYAASVALAAINGLPTRARRPASLGGVTRPVPALPPGERRRRRKQ